MSSGRTALPAAGDWGPLFREARLRAGLTMTEAGALAGTSQSRISTIEAGKTVPTLSAANRLLEAYSMRVAFEPAARVAA